MSKKMGLFLSAMSFFLVSCFHNDEIRKELFNVNTRLLALENELQDKQQANSRQYVTASGRVSQMQEDIQKLKGEVDRLQIGVQKGEIPGMPNNPHEPSVAHQLASINEKLHQLDLEKIATFEDRLIALEKAQNEILTILEKMDTKKKGASSKKANLNSLKTIEAAFHKKQFQAIVEEAPHLLADKSHHKQDIDKIRYFYSESLFKVGNVRDAAISFGELMKKENLGEYGPKIHLRMGDCFKNLGDKKTAIAYYKKLIEKFPNSTESESAKKQLKTLQES